MKPTSHGPDESGRPYPSISAPTDGFIPAEAISSLARMPISPEAILLVAERHHSGEGIPEFVPGTAEHPLAGGQCTTYGVQFPDGSTSAVRVPLHLQDQSPEFITYLTEQEVSILKRLEECGFVWSPRVLAYDSGFDNLLNYPYMVVSWIEGKPLRWSYSVPASNGIRQKVLRQMATILFELVSCTEVPGMMALLYLVQHAD